MEGVLISLFYLGNTLYAVSYAVRNIMTLRVLSVFAGLAAIPYFVGQDVPLWSAVLWQGVYIAVNVVNIGLLLHDRTPVELTDELERVHLRVFPLLTSREVKTIAEIAEIRDIEPNTVMINDGDEVRELLLIIKGGAEVQLSDGDTAKLESMNFVGELSFTRASLARGRVIAKEPIRVLSWSRANLRNLQRNKPGLERMIRSAVAMDMANKLAK